MRRNRRIEPHASALVAMLVTVCLGWSATSASAQSGTGLAGKGIGADAEVTAAAQAAEEALKSAATKGEATRGASGAVASLLTESDTLVCSAWILSFRVRYRNMVLEGADAATLRAMENLMEKVEKACDKVLTPVPENKIKVGGEGETTEEKEEKPKPIYPYCPECDELKRVLDKKTAEHERAQWELAQAMRRTDFLERIEKSNASPDAKKAASGGETVEDAEKVESRKRGAADTARIRSEEARAELVDCLEKCHKKKFSFLGKMGTGTKVAIGSGAAAGVAAIALAGGGSDSSGALPSSPANTTGVPAPPSSGASGGGVTVCAGDYRSSLNVSSDPGNHRRNVRMPANMTLFVTIASIHIRGAQPFVQVDGTIDSQGNFDATGMGTVAGFRNVAVRMSGTLRECTASSGTLAATYSMGTGGELPGGQSITYEVRGAK